LSISALVSHSSQPRRPTAMPSSAAHRALRWPHAACGLSSSRPVSTARSKTV
jgi:hypothetical protein